MTNLLRTALLIGLLIFPLLCHSLNLLLPTNGSDIVGEIIVVKSVESDTLSDIARNYDLGYSEITQANPGVNAWLPGEGTPITLPMRFILPPGERKGVVINLAEMRLYYYPPGGKEVVTYPIGIGREGWSTPTGMTQVRKTLKNPSWYPPESIRKEYAAEGNPLDLRIPPGPDNPLGGYAIYLNLQGYLLHGTNKPYGVGMRVSHGCIRLYPEDIENFFTKIKVGTSVRIINEPFKAGKDNQRLFIEVHRPLQEQLDEDGDNLTPLMATILAQTEREGGKMALDWKKLRDAAQQKRGIPVPISRQR